MQQPFAGQQVQPVGPNVVQQPGYGQPMPEQPVGQQPGYGQPQIQPAFIPGGWMPPVEMIPNCPAGLEYLAQIDRLVVKQDVELLEALSGCETANKYKIYNAMGQIMYQAKEKSSCLGKQFLGAARAWEMEVTNNEGYEVIHMNSPFRLCIPEVTITSPATGEVLGSVVRRWVWSCDPVIDIFDCTGTPVLSIKGPCCGFAMCGDSNFTVMDPNDNAVGVISKKLMGGGFVQQAFTDADNFNISFPVDLDCKMKATLLGACLLVDFMFFEESSNTLLDCLLGGSDL